MTSKLVDIAITDLAVEMIIGVRTHERKHMQKVIFEFYLTYDASDAMVSGDMKDVVDYWQLSKEITEWLGGASYFLLETLLQDVLAYVMKDERIQASKVIIHKPKALEQFGAKVSLSGSAMRDTTLLNP